MTGTRLAGKVALVTGAAGGIGRATVLRLSAEGALVHATDLDVDALDAAAASSGRLDVTDPASCAASVADALATHGRLDIVVNVAGIGQMGRVENLSFDEWRRVLAVDLDGVFLMSKAALPALLDSRGCIVNVSSVAALFGQPYTTAYTVAKAGVVALTKSMGVELDDRGVRVNCVCPGGVATAFAADFDFSGLDESLMKRTFMKKIDLVEADEIAGAIAYLASDDARSVNASVINVDRGMHAM